jgi:multidrug efflux pump subunit AcrA (membrane-fusion protein)
MIHQKRIFAALSVVVLLALTLAGCAGQAGAQTGSGSSGFTGYGTVTKVNYTATVESTGQIQPQHMASITWSTTGTIAQSNVQVGQTVNAGDTLMTLDPASVPSNLLTARTDLTNAQNALNQLTNPDPTTVSNAESALASAFSNYQQAQNNLSDAIVSNQAANEATLYNDWSSTKTALDAAQNNLPLANASIDVQAFYQAVRTTSLLQSELKVAQDSATIHPDDTALAQKVADLQVALQDSQTKQNNLQVGLPTDTVNLVTTLSSSLSAYETSATNFIGSVITDTTNTSVNLAQLQADLAQKQSSLLSAQSTLTDQINTREGMNGTRCTDATIADYQAAYDRALTAWNLSGHLPNSREYQALQTAAANLTWCSSVYSAAELAAADANIASTRAQIQLLQAQIATDQAQISNGSNSVYGLAIQLNTVWTAYQDASQQLSNAVTSVYELQRSPNPDDLAAAQAKVQAAQAAVNSLTLTAPFSGEVTSVAYQPGDGVDNKTAAVVLVDRSKLNVDLQVAETDVVKLSVGDTATITLEAQPTIALTGSVSYINPVGTSSQGVVYYDVRVVLDQADPQILIGATADVTIQAGQPQDVLAVPVSAVQSDSSGEFVYVIASNGSSQQVTVVSGTILPNDLVIVQGNLKEGDTVGLLQSSTGTNSGGGLGGGGRFIP